MGDELDTSEIRRTAESVRSGGYGWGPGPEMLDACAAEIDRLRAQLAEFNSLIEYMKKLIRECDVLDDVRRAAGLDRRTGGETE